MSRSSSEFSVVPGLPKMQSTPWATSPSMNT